jgi:hypothetical protein
MATTRAKASNGAAKGTASVAFGQKVCPAKSTARLRITPTTAAVTAVSSPKRRHAG